tara:strand:- start:4318 stop:4659 length:342 start_codon:yes stop_codon:yes gene_type:complete
MNIPPILESKKFLASVLASVISFLGMQRGMTSEQIAFVVGPIVAYIAMQGVADVGKSRAQIEAVFKPNATSVNVTNVQPSPQSVEDQATILEILKRNPDAVTEATATLEPSTE